jgi:hypothetical protein
MPQQNVPQNIPDQGKNPQQGNPPGNKPYSGAPEKDERRSSNPPTEDTPRRASQADKELDETDRQDLDIAP